jgi:ligand-binding sensor domain-containing protein
MQKILVLFLFLLLGQCAWAQSFTNFSTKNGLPSNHVYRITQDNQGFIWILTDKGMVKYNGAEFKTFTTQDGLPSNDIWDIRITPDNKVWFFTKATKLGYIFNDRVFTFSKPNKNKEIFPVAINQNKNDISFFDGVIYYYLADNVWKPKQSKTKKTYNEFFIHKKNSYFQTNKEETQIQLLNNDSRIIKTFPINKAILKTNYRGQINDSLYCWISNQSITLLNLNKLALHYIPIKKEVARLMRFNTINNQIQFSGENFLAILNTDYTLKIIPKIPKKLHSHFSFKDRAGNIWLATFNNGVYFYPKAKQNANYQLENLKITKINNVKDKIIALVYNSGFYKYDKKKKLFEPFLNLEEYLYSATYIDSLKSSFYVGSKHTIKINNNKTIYNSFEKARKLKWFNGFLFSNSSSGLNRLDASSFQKKTHYSQIGIQDLIVFNNTLLLATSEGLKFLGNEYIKPVLIADSIFNKPLNVLAKTKKELFIGTTGFGAYVSDLKTISLLEKSDYLDISNIYINNNTVYLATNQGVWLYIKKDEVYRLKRKYTIKDGLNTNQINDTYALNGRLITASNNGVSIIPLRQKREHQLLDIYFENIQYNKQKITSDSHLDYQKNNHLQVKVASIDFSEKQNISYNYQLKPIQNNWTNIHTSLISFNGLAPNDYELIIEKEGYSKHFTFTIEPLWYQTTWFKVATPIIIIFMLLGIALWFRKKELQKQQKKLADTKKLAEYELHALRSQMNPHFVFNSLNAIQYYITKNDNELSEKYLVKFARLIRMFFDFSREKEILLSDEIKLLKGYLEIEKMRFGSDFNYTVKLINPKNIDSFKIPTMLLQPIVENAVNHGLFHNKGKGLIEVVFELKNSHKLDVLINDNGVGIKKAKEIQAQSIRAKKKNNSTQVIKERIELLNQSKKWIVNHYILATEIGTSINLIFTKNE